MSDEASPPVPDSPPSRYAAVEPILAEIDRRLVREEPVQEIFRHVAERMAGELGLPLVWIGLKAPDGSVESQVAVGEEAAYLEGVEIRWDDTPEGRGPTGEAMRTGEPVGADILRDPAFEPWRESAMAHGLVASLAVPLRTKGRTVGALNLYARERDDLEDGRYRLFRRVADQLSVAVLRARDVERLRVHTRALEAIGEGVALLSREGRIEWVNPTFSRLMGRPPGEAEGRHLSAVMTPAEGAEDLRDVVDRADRWSGLLTVDRPDGERRLLRTTLSPVSDHEGLTTHLVVVCRDVTEVRRRERELAESREHLESLLTTVPAVIFRLELPGIRPSYVSPNFRDQTGYPVERFLEDPDFWRARVPEEDVERIEREIGEGLDRPDGRVEAEFRVEHADGTLHWYHAEARLVCGAEGKPRAVVGSALDVTDRREAREELRRSERRYRTLFERAQEAISITTPEGRFVDVNPAWLELLGYDREELEGRTVRDCCADPEEYRRFMAALEADGYVNRMEMKVRHRDGEVLHCLVSSTVHNHAGDEGGQIHHVSFLQDISDRKRFEEELRYQALHDALTGLPNRALFRDRLEQAVARADRQGSTLLLAYLDLDRFKSINDSYGHSTGDRLLRTVGRQLSRLVRGQDTAARIGGDEFVLLIEGLEDGEEAETARDRLVDGVRSCTESAGVPHHVTASIGIVGYDGDGEVDGEALLQRADLAMYEAKKRSGTSFHVFDPRSDVAGLGRLEREQELRDALEAGQFSPAYQPVVELETGAVWGLELLARWDHPDRGRVSPAEFIPVAEETGLILEMGRQLLEAGMEDLADWHEAGHAPRLLFNLSASQFDDPLLPELVQDHLERIGLPASSLFLEVTETELMQSPQRIEPVRELGVRLVVDDFGTGYSSLGYLRDLDVDALKIDLSFVHGMTTDEEDRAIVETILTLGQRLGLGVIAEGIETRRQELLLRSLGCELGQGFRYARPVPAGEIGRLLSEGGRV